MIDQAPTHKGITIWYEKQTDKQMMTCTVIDLTSQLTDNSFSEFSKLHIV